VNALIAALPMRQQMFSSAGCGNARLPTAAQTDLSGDYVMRETTWTMPPADPDSGVAALDLHSTFILRRHDCRLRIVFYLNHQDLAKLLADRA